MLPVSWNPLLGQGTVIDRVAAVVGKNMILQSDLDAQYFQYRMQGSIEGTEHEVKCRVLEMMLLEKLLLNQAELDSIEVSDSDVEVEMDRRLRYFIAQFGSQQKLEEFYQKSITEIKDEFRELIRDQRKVEQVQQGIIKNIAVTPSEVKTFYKTIPRDSLPLINAQVEIAQIVKIPPVSLEQKVILKERLRELRKRILAGESFATLAILYSEDPGSAAKGGELGFYGRGELYPEFEAAAFKLGDGEISEIVETKAGLHIIQMIERKEEYINVRHILLMTKPSPLEVEKAQLKLDSIASDIRAGVITFDEAVKKYSDDPGKANSGLMINPNTGNTTFEMAELEPQVSFVIDRLEIGEVSNTVPMKTDEGEEAYRLLMVKKRTEPHRANLEDDYNYIQELALKDKQGKKLNEWIGKHLDNAYIMIIPEYQDCPFTHNWPGTLVE
jgi:peptidyl-prolyl cis-trans isomerase SurA